MHPSIISQYANSPVILALVDYYEQDIKPDVDIDGFYDYVWNVLTAQGFGLDIWGRIVNIGRELSIPDTALYLGFSEGNPGTPLNQPFGQAPFYAGAPPTSSVYRLADDAYRTLILAKALANISNCTAPSINRLLQVLFAGRGRTYVADTGAMRIRYVFEFQLTPAEWAIVTQSGALARPAAVLAQALTVDIPNTFGFAEAGIYQPFGQGVFFSSTGLANAA